VADTRVSYKESSFIEPVGWGGGDSENFFRGISQFFHKNGGIIIIIVIVIIIIGSVALGGPWPPQANVTSIHPPISTNQLPCIFFYHVSLS
jgi:hypothetical protein